MHETSIKTVEESEPEKPHMFVLTCEKEDLLFAAENEAELEEWLMVLKDEIDAIENSPSKLYYSLSSNGHLCFACMSREKSERLSGSLFLWLFGDTFGYK